MLKRFRASSPRSFPMTPSLGRLFVNRLAKTVADFLTISSPSASHESGGKLTTTQTRRSPSQLAERPWTASPTRRVGAGYERSPRRTRHGRIVIHTRASPSTRQGTIDFSARRTFHVQLGRNLG